MNLYRLVSQGRKKHQVRSSTRVHKEPNLNTTQYIIVTTTPTKPTTLQLRRGSSSRNQVRLGSAFLISQKNVSYRSIQGFQKDKFGKNRSALRAKFRLQYLSFSPFFVISTIMSAGSDHHSQQQQQQHGLGGRPTPYTSEHPPAAHFRAEDDREKSQPPELISFHDQKAPHHRYA